MDILSRTYSIYVAVGIGKRYPSIMEISQSYIEAERALICKKGNINQIIHVTDISEDRPTLFFSAFEKKQLMKAIFDHEKQEAINKMKGFFAQGQNYSSLTEMKLFLLQFFLSDVDERLSRGFSNKMENLQQIVQLAECDSIEELERLTLKQIDVIFEEMHQMKDFFNRKLINKALNYIHENLEKNLTLEEVANLIYLSPYYFSRQFKIMTKMNFIRYVTNVRIEKSKELLSKTDWNITKIALKTGFQNANYFCKVFKKITGYTPGDWRIKNGLK
jgi:two-component system response regulator YesN